MTLQFGPILEVDFVDKRRADGQTNTSPLGTPGSYVTESALDTRLNAISSTSYSAKRLRIMTTNDKIYAVRVNDDAAGI
jgi:hypothetical protein